MDYPSNLPAFSREGLLGLLRGVYDQSSLGDATRVGQGLLSGDYGSAATNLGLLGLGITPVGKAAKAVQKVYRAKKIGKGHYEYRGWEIEHIGKEAGETSERGHWNLGTKNPQGMVEWHDGSESLSDAKSMIDRWFLQNK
tara:strand:+ start:117 stop:536 length:420 start_codon:yes stop_codon:yes gene_type:complete